MGFRFVIWFVDHLWIITTKNYSVITNLHTLQFTVAHAKFSVFSLGIAWQRIWTVSSASVLTLLLAAYHLTTAPHLGIHWLWVSNSQVKVMLRSIVSWPVCLCVKLNQGPKTRFLWLSVVGLFMWGALCDGRMGLSFTIAAGSCQHSYVYCLQNLAAILLHEL
jgi:hypothetical protein